MERENAWKSYTDQDKSELNELCEGYKSFLSQCKTERLATKRAIELASAAGYAPLAEAIAEKRALKPGDKVWIDNYGKAIMLVQIGTNDIEAGVNILGAHIDSPRLDLKQNPLYEASDFVLLDTHYYGGIKKYQWVTIPLELHGTVALKDGSTVDIAIGREPDEPQFVITDLLPHLGKDQMRKTMEEGITGEALNIVIGSMPYAGEGRDRVKLAVLSLLYDEYGITEEDFLSAELAAVPAFPSRDIGFDRSMIMGYGHDDRVCSYTSLAAMLKVENPVHTSCCLLVDKEEVGSNGATGMHSRFFENIVAELIALTSASYSDLILRRCLKNSKMLSSDVSAAFDPNYPEVNERKNSAFCGRGFTFNKYTGARGKSGCNDANAEYIAYLRKVMDDAGVFFQTSELGKVDQGGGGTIAYILANLNMEVIDCGVPVLNMHAPWEVVSKIDVYETCRGYEAFLRAEK